MKSQLEELQNVVKELLLANTTLTQQVKTLEDAFFGIVQELHPEETKGVFNKYLHLLHDRYQSALDQLDGDIPADRILRERVELQSLSKAINN